MIFLIDKIETIHEVVVYKDIIDIATSIEWQDIFEGDSLIIDEKGIEYE